jgi:maltose-binding protein MalE
VACGTSSPSTSVPTSPGLSAPEQQTTLIFWHAWPSPDQHILAKLVDQYNQSHAGTQVVMQSMSFASLSSELQAAAIAGSGPHVVLLQNHTIGNLVQEGILLPLDQFLSPEEYAVLLSNALKGAQVKDANGIPHLYGLPLTFDTLVLYYNRLRYRDRAPKTWEDLRTSENALATGETTQLPAWGLAYTLSLDKTIGYFYAYGGVVFDQQGELVLGTEGRAGAEHWLEWVQAVHQEPETLAVSDSIAVNNALKSQRAWATIDWSHALPTYQTLWGEHFGIAPLPHIQSNDTLYAQPYVQSYVVSINARVVEYQEQQAVLDFLRYLVSEKAQQTLLDAGKQPALNTLDLSGESLVMQAASVCRSQAHHGQPMPNDRVMNEIVRDELERMQLTVLRGLKTPSDAVTDADNALHERLNQVSPEE